MDANDPRSLFEKLGFDLAAELLTQVRHTGIVSDRDLAALRGLVNNSLVGASKLLHFVAPGHFAIWDSNIYAFVFEEQPHPYRLNKIEKYHIYLEKLGSLQRDARFDSFHQSVNSKIGYQVSKLRALELVMVSQCTKRKCDWCLGLTLPNYDTDN